MIRQTRRKLRVLDFDIETRRIGFHYGGRFAPDGCEPVAIAWSWVGDDDVDVMLLGEHDPRMMLRSFRGAYDQADIVTGHYIRKFDLPILTGAYFEKGMPLLDGKLVSDTKTDLLGMAGLSKSQENLSALKKLEESKFHMNDTAWRAVARLEPAAMKMARKRVVDDVIQHKRLRESLIEAGALGPARRWEP